MAEVRYWREQKRTWLKDVVPLDTPFNIDIEVSSLCNIKCIYCAHSTTTHDAYEGNMSMELFGRVIEEIRQFPKKVKLIETYAFGEPLCNPHLAEMIRLIREAEITERVDFTTNGLLFTPEKADAILAAGVDTIRISLQGIDAAMYQKMCGAKIDFDKFLFNLKYLYDHRGRCKIRMKIPDLALKDVPDGEEKFRNIFDGMADSLFVEHLLPIYSDVNYNEIDPMIRVNAMNGRAGIPQEEIHKVCHRPFYRLRVTANGEVMAACCDDPHDIRYGSIYENHLVDLWNGEGHKSFLKMQLEGRRFQHPICRECVLPNDITAEEDILDPWASEILERMR